MFLIRSSTTPLAILLLCLAGSLPSGCDGTLMPAGDFDGSATTADAGAKSGDGALASDAAPTGDAPDAAGTPLADTGPSTVDAGSTPSPDSGPVAQASAFVSFLGGSAFEQARDVAVDNTGNIIVVGGTQSSDFPVTPGAYQTNFPSGGTGTGSGGSMAVFVVKLAPDGKLLWSTFVAGPAYDRAYAVEVDAKGDVYIAGRAGPGFPTTAGVAQPTFAGDNSPNGLYGKQDGFVAKLSADGKKLLWSTYIGGPGRAFIRDFAIDGAGNVYAGVTAVFNAFPHVTAGAYRTTRPGARDNVLVALSADGSQVLWGTYLGGSADESVPSVRLNAAGQPVVMFSTQSADAPVTPGAYQGQLRGASDALILRLSADGKTLLAGSYFGGTGDEYSETHHLALDGAGNAVFGSGTTSKDLPTTPGALQSSRKGNSNGYIARLSADAKTLLASSYLGGSVTDHVEGIAVTAKGDICAGGGSQSPDLPVSGGARAFSAKADGWAGCFSSDLSQVRYLAYLGSGQDDSQRSLWVDAAGNIITVGQTASAGFPASANAVQKTYGGGKGDAYVARLLVP